MTGLAFLCGIGVLFIGLLAYESEDGGARLRDSQRGLWTWLIADNWPAKVGGVLLVIGLGALLRYTLLHARLPPDMKLSAGVVLAAVLGYLSYRLHALPARRSLFLALAGAAGGVAYLTAYSAFVLFGYLNDLVGLTLLVLVCAAVAVFAVCAQAASMAVLAMLGAYVAPAFGLGEPGPLVVFGYYFACSSLVMVLVMARGWRALIHLSFLFTLAGSLFFGWTAHYYQPEHYAVMQPLLYLLVALHIAMPIVERRATIFAAVPSTSEWPDRLDQGYFVALPMVAVILTYCIAPHIAPEAAWGTAGLAALWAVAGAAVSVNRREALRYGIVALLLVTAALLAGFNDIPGTLIVLFAMAVLLTIAVRLQLPETVAGLASFLVTLLAALYVVQSMFEHGSGTMFFNAWFGQRVVAVAIVAWCAWLRDRQAPGYARLLYSIAAVLLFESIVIELLRWQLRITAELVHALAVAAVVVAAYRARRWSSAARVVWVATPVLWLSALWAAEADTNYATVLVMVLFVADTVALVYAARRFAGTSRTHDNTAMLLLIALPLLAATWTPDLLPRLEQGAGFRLMSVVSFATLAMCLFATRIEWLDERWTQHALPALFWFNACLLGAITLCYVARGLWPALYELSTLALLATLYWLLRVSEQARWRGIVTLIGAALVLQAGLLRLLTPALADHEVLSVLDVTAMSLPAVLSLVWAMLGAALALWSGRTGLRSTWTAGSILMAVAAGKLILFDFGSLGELGNILALIAAGVVFLLVAWLVPMPPRGTLRAAPLSTPPFAGHGDETPVGSGTSAPDGPKPRAPSLEFGAFNLRPRAVVSATPPAPTASTDAGTAPS